MGEYYYTRFGIPAPAVGERAIDLLERTAVYERFGLQREEEQGTEARKSQASAQVRSGSSSPAINQEALERITDRIARARDSRGRALIPLLTISEFFDGNTVVGSIGANLFPVPQPEEVREALEAIAARAEVAEVRVQISGSEAAWPFSDMIWVITSAAMEEVKGWFPEVIRPDEVRTGWMTGKEYEPVEVPQGMKPIGCFWD